MAERICDSAGPPHDQAYWSTFPMPEWLRKNGVRAPYCVQRTQSSAFALPMKPPTSAPTKG